MAATVRALLRSTAGDGRLHLARLPRRWADWAGRSTGSLATDLVARPGTVAGRTLAALYLVSALSLAVCAQSAESSTAQTRFAQGLAAVCAAIAVVVWRRDVGQRLLGSLLVVGDLLTTVLVVTSSDPLLATMMWNGYLLVVVCFVLVTRPRAVAAQLLLVLLASSTALHVTGLPLTVLVASALVVLATAAPLCLLTWAAPNAVVDDVTGLPNRRGAAPVLSAAVDASERDLDRPLALAVVDVDELGTVNAHLGWKGGDELLARLAKEMRQNLPPGTHLSRSGGDLFTVLLPDTVPGGSAGAAQALEAALAALSHPVSAGLAVHDPGEGPTDLVRRAGAALTHAKLHLRGRVHLAPAGTGALVRDLAEALAAPAEHGLAVVLQPVVDVVTGAVVGAEALARWASPRRGPVNPLEFVTAAEGSGLVTALGAFVVRAACREIAPLRARWGGAVFLTVNASGHELVDPRYVDRLLGALEAERFPATALVVEVTESVLDGGSPSAVATLHALRAQGVRVAVDDFGAGYSCFTRLDEVPADFLKLDATLLETAPQSPRRRTLLATAVALADSLGLVAIAEGAETPEQAALLVELECPLVQGYGYGYARPAPAADLLALGPVRRGAGAGAAA